MKVTSPVRYKGGLTQDISGNLERDQLFPFNLNTNQNNVLHTNTIIYEVKQSYPPNTLIKGEIKPWPSSFLIQDQ